MSFPLKIVTPKGLYQEVEVDSLSVKLSSGYRTFLKGHVPLIGAVEYAPMHYVKNGKVESFALHGGAINVTKNGIILIVNGIEHKKDIDINRAEAARKRAEERLASKDPNIDMKRAEVALLRSLSRIKTYNE